VVTVQRALGHKSANVTLSTYSHLWPTAEDRTRKAAQAIMLSALNPVADCVRTEAIENPVQARYLDVEPELHDVAVPRSVPSLSVASRI